MASYCLGNIAQNDRGDYLTAIKWYLAPAAHGNMEAIGNLGIAYGITKQYDQAVFWLKKGADMDDEMCLSRLAHHYAKGWGVEPDMDKAFRLFGRSAQLGDMYGCYAFGELCLRQETLDVTKAENAFITAANADFAPAKTLLATIYMGYHGDEFIDYELAEDLLAAAYNSGDFDAAYYLGIFKYYISKDPKSAYDILSYAASQGCDSAAEVLSDLFGKS